MYSEILKIIPRIESAELAKMQNDLSRRFANVAKKFGSGLKNALIGGGIIAAAGALLAKVLNPLQEITETIEKTLDRADNLATDAKEFQSSSGNLFKLQTIAKSVGVDEGALNMALTKFQTSLVEARQPGAKPSAVSNFTDITDTVDAFYSFANSLKDAPKDLQVLAQVEIFGERLSGKLRELLQTDLVGRSGELALKGSDEYTRVIDRAGAVSDLDQNLRAKTNAADFLGKANKITESMVIQRDKGDKLQSAREIARFDSYDNIKSVSNSMQKLNNNVEDGISKILTLLPALFEKLEFAMNIVTQKMAEIILWLQNITNSPFMRGVTSGIKSLFGGK